MRKSDAVICGLVFFGVPGFLIGCLPWGFVSYGGIRPGSALLFTLLVTAASVGFGVIVGLLVSSDDPV